MGMGYSQWEWKNLDIFKFNLNPKSNQYSMYTNPILPNPNPSPNHNNTLIVVFNYVPVAKTLILWQIAPSFVDIFALSLFSI